MADKLNSQFGERHICDIPFARTLTSSVHHSQQIAYDDNHKILHDFMSFPDLIKNARTSFC